MLPTLATVFAGSTGYMLGDHGPAWSWLSAGKNRLLKNFIFISCPAITFSSHGVEPSSELPRGSRNRTRGSRNKRRVRVWWASHSLSPQIDETDTELDLYVRVRVATTPPERAR